MSVTTTRRPLTERQAALREARANETRLENDPTASRLDRFHARQARQDAERDADPTTEEYARLPWASIPESRRYTSDLIDTPGKRYVFGWVDGSGTCLVPWTGPTTKEN